MTMMNVNALNFDLPYNLFKLGTSHFYIESCKTFASEVTADCIFSMSQYVDIITVFLRT